MGLMPVIPSLGRLRQDGGFEASLKCSEFEVNLDYKVRPSLKKKEEGKEERGGREHISQITDPLGSSSLGCQSLCSLPLQTTLKKKKSHIQSDPCQLPTDAGAACAQDAKLVFLLQTGKALTASRTGYRADSCDCGTLTPYRKTSRMCEVLWL